MTPDRIIQIVCEVYNTTPDEIMKLTCHRRRAEPRHMAAHIIFERTDLTKKQIEGIFNYKPYGARYGIRVIKSLLRLDRATQVRYEAINEKIEAEEKAPSYNLSFETVKEIDKNKIKPGMMVVFLNNKAYELNASTIKVNIHP